MGALEIRQNAFLKVAQTTSSANERNYLLGLILEEKGDIDFTKQLAPLNLRAYSGLSSASLLQRLKYRFKAETADNIELSLTVNVEGESFQLAVKNNVLRIKPVEPSKLVDAQLSRSTLVAITARTQALGEAAGWNMSPMRELSALID